MQEDNVYLFHGTEPTPSVAVFSSLEKAKIWIRTHRLTGNLVEHTVDEPGFDKCKNENRLPSYLQNLTNDEQTVARERFVDGVGWHHFFYGLSADDDGYTDAQDQWESAQDQLDS